MHIIHIAISVPKQKSAQNQGNKSITRPLINHRWAKYYHISLALRFESNASTWPSAFAIFASIPISRRKNISSRCFSRFLMSAQGLIYKSLADSKNKIRDQPSHIQFIIMLLNSASNTANDGHNLATILAALRI